MVFHISSISEEFVKMSLSLPRNSCERWSGQLDPLIIPKICRVRGAKTMDLSFNAGLDLGVAWCFAVYVILVSSGGEAIDGLWSMPVSKNFPAKMNGNICYAI